MIDYARGQAATETLVAVALVLILLLFVAWQVSYRTEFNDTAKEMYGNASFCSRISVLINMVSNNYNDDNILIDTDRGMAIANHIISVGDDYCTYYADVMDVSLSAGTVRIYDYNGVVYLENI